MKNESGIILSKTEFETLSALVKASNSEAAVSLEEEISRAELVDEELLPPNIVRMNSEVGFVDLETGVEQFVVLVYPREANIEEDKISVLSPAGSALIGLSVGQSIRWPLPNGSIKSIQVVSVTND